LEGKKIIFPEEDLINVPYELDSKKLRKVISDKLNSLEKTNPKLFKFFTVEMTDQDEEKEDIVGLQEFFRIKEETVKKHQTEYESIFHFIDRAIKGLKLVPYSYLTEKIHKTVYEDSQAKSRKNLTGVMKVTLFKSFDSSIFTFSKRVTRYKTYLEQFERLFFEDKILVKPSIIQKAITALDDEPDEDIIDLINDEISKFKEREEQRSKSDKDYKKENAYLPVNLEEYNVDNIKRFIQQ